MCFAISFVSVVPKASLKSGLVSFSRLCFALNLVSITARFSAQIINENLADGSEYSPPV